jgi:hypothetical protein
MTLTEDEQHRLALKDADDEPLENLEAAARIYDSVAAGRCQSCDKSECTCRQMPAAHDEDQKHYWVMFEDADRQAQHINYARFRHFGARDDEQAIEFAHQFAPGWATGFVLYEKDGPGGSSKRRVGTYDITCEGCGARNHPGTNCT